MSNPNKIGMILRRTGLAFMTISALLLAFISLDPCPDIPLANFQKELSITVFISFAIMLIGIAIEFIWNLSEALAEKLNLK